MECRKNIGEELHSHFNFQRDSLYPGAVTLSGQDGDDAKNYQERQVKRAIEEVDR